jgi:hypothetical protein
MAVGIDEIQISLETNHFHDNTTLPDVDEVTDGTVIDRVRLVFRL